MTGKSLAVVGEILTATIDPLGCRVSSLTHHLSGSEVLFQAPWRVASPDEGPVDRKRWLEAWGGGWDLLVPNAGAPADVDGRSHGFHGNASLELWDVQLAGPTEVCGRWLDRSGLAVERRINVLGTTLRIESTLSNQSWRPLPFVWVEHLVLEARTFGPATISSAGDLVAISDLGPPTTNWQSLAEVSSPVRLNGSRLSAEVRWSTTALPHLWIWVENQSGTWLPEDRMISCVGLEPANTTTGEGLAVSRTQGDGAILPANGKWHCWVELDVTQS